MNSILLALLLLVLIQHCPSQSPKMNIEEIINEIGGMDKVEDMSVDDLYLPNFTEKELKDLKKNDPDFWENAEQIIKNEEEDKLTGKVRKDTINKARIEIGLHSMLLLALDMITDDKISPGIRRANDLFYKLYDISERVGINQELRDTIVQLVDQARENIEVINMHWAKNRQLIRAKFIRTLDQLEKHLEDIPPRVDPWDDILSNEVDEEVILAKLAQFDAEEGEMSDWDIRQAEYDLEDAEEMLKSCQKQEAHFRKLLNTFLKEEKSLIRLSVNLWINSQVDSTDEDEVEQQPLKDEEIAIENERVNRLRRQLITDMNVNRAKAANQTANSTLSSGSRKESNSPQKKENSKRKDEL